MYLYSTFRNFDVQNTDERIETQSHYEVKMLHNQHI